VVGLWRSQGMCGPCCGESVAVDEVFGMERGGDGQDLQDAGLQDGRRWGGGTMGVGFFEGGFIRCST
jgi:hypothetical protein